MRSLIGHWMQRIEGRRFTISLMLIGGFWLPVGASQAALIHITGADGSPNINITEGTASTDVYIRIQGQASDNTANEIAAFNYTFLLGDGGPLVGGSDVVPISSVAYTGTGTGPLASVWDGVSGVDQTVAPGTLPQNSAGIFSVFVLTNGENGTFDGTTGSLLTDLETATVLARLTLDTSDLVAGDVFDLTVFSTFGSPTGERFVPAGGGAFTTQSLAIANGGNGTLTVSVVPEPGTALLMGLGLAGLASRRRR